jgi:dihydropteroate synthase
MKELSERLVVATDAGVDPELVALDPGIGFAKTGEQNWEVLAGLERLHALGRPLLVGTSRKRFLGTLLAGPDGEPRPEQRDDATAATTVLAAAAGAWCVRVHTVPPNRDAVQVAARWGREVR